ncbi:MAG TPA: MEDS domain-containing protein [Mycobacteriales bacterium]|nr:MEDS domain-containing protein [Mycobacteriales bacterium]
MAPGPYDLLEPHDHVVNFYDGEEDLVAELARYVAEGLRQGEAVVVVATQAHRDAVTAGLARYGTDGERAQETGHYRCLDAAETLAAFMVEGEPERSQFRTVVGELVARAAEGGRPVRAFGEMVALLCADGNFSGAIQLEGLWNELGRDYPFSLYCAYPIAVLAGPGDLTAARQVCDRHSTILGPLSYTARAARAPAIDGTAERSEMFVPVPTAVHAVRRFLSDTLAAWGEDDLVADAALIGSELASNAVQHAGSPFRASIQRSDSVVRIAVHDLCSVLPVRLDHIPDRSGGRGVALVAGLSRRWGSDVVPDGKVVWSELARSQTSSRSMSPTPG